MDKTSSFLRFYQDKILIQLILIMNYKKMISMKKQNKTILSKSKMIRMKNALAYSNSFKNRD